MSSPTVMILESDPSVRALLAAIVRRSGLRAVTPRDGETAIAELMSSQTDALVLDVSAPSDGSDAVLGYMRDLAPALLPRTLLIGAEPDTRGLRSMQKPICIDQIEPEILACVAMSAAPS